MSESSTVSRPDYLSSLNDAQREAATFGVAPDALAGPLLVIAGAGTGKTNTLAHRVAHLLVNGAQPESVMLLTFSRRAADEMTRRVQRIVAQVSPRFATLASAGFPWSGTFHSVGARLLREYAGLIGLDPAFTIHDREDSADLMNLVRHDIGLSSKAKRFPLKGTCLAIYSAAVNTQSPLADVLQSSFPWCAEWEADLKTLFRAYVEAKQAQQVLDYDDLLLYWAQMAAEPAIARELGERFAHVLVDEYQDTNRLQSSILLSIKPDGRGLTVVGDDAQSIYSFRGATVRNILDFPQQFDPPARRITLEQNYRSTPPLLDAANAVIGEADERFVKQLWSVRTGTQKPLLVSVRDDAAQAEFVVTQILARREGGMKLKSQAVLFRTSSHSMRLEIELTRRNIPFVKFGGLKFLEAAHVKDLLSVLRWAQNLRDRVAGFRAIQLLAGIGPKTAARILDNIQAAPPGAALLAEQPVPEGVRACWSEFSALVEAAGAERAEMAGQCRTGGALVRSADGSSVRGCRRARCGHPATRTAGVDLSESRALPYRAHAGPSRSDQRRAGRAAARRGLPHPVDHPLRQGARVERGVGAQRGRRRHSVGNVDRQPGRDRGGKTPALRCDDAREGAARAGGAAALLHHRSGVDR